MVSKLSVVGVFTLFCPDFSWSRTAFHFEALGTRLRARARDGGQLPEDCFRGRIFDGKQAMATTSSRRRTLEEFLRASIKRAHFVEFWYSW